MAYDAHCRRKGCRCTHSHGCYRGWLDVPATATTPEHTSPCPICRPGTPSTTQPKERSND